MLLCFSLIQNNSNLRNRIRTSMAVGVAYCLDPMDIGQVTTTRGKAGRVSRLANSNAACFPVIALPWLLIGQDHLDFMPVVLWKIGQFGRHGQCKPNLLCWNSKSNERVYLSPKCDLGCSKWKKLSYRDLPTSGCSPLATPSSGSLRTSIWEFSILNIQLEQQTTSTQ